MKDFDREQFKSVGLQAIRLAMQVVSDHQKRLSGSELIEVKVEDKTLVTNCDRQSGSAIHEALRLDYSKASFSIEDVNTTSNQSPIVFLADPLDGTRAFTLGLPTSTVIIAPYDIESKRILACYTGLPATGQFWYADDADSLKRDGVTNVWQGQRSEQGTVLLDVNHGFVRKENGEPRQVLYNENVARLFEQLSKESKLLMPGSNGLHHALVANGCSGMLGAVTTAIGGPWDIAGIKHVKSAGGCVRLFRFDDLRVLRILQNDEDILSADLAISANNEDTLDWLTRLLKRCL